LKKEVNVKVCIYHTTKAERGSRVSALLILDLGAKGDALSVSEVNPTILRATSSAAPL
jgi:hypothetical protein